MYYETEYRSWGERNPYTYCTLWKNLNTGIVSRDDKPLENLETCLFRLMNIRKVNLGGKFTYLITSPMTESKIFFILFDALEKCWSLLYDWTNAK